MSKTKKGFEWSQHVEKGKELKLMQKNLGDICNLIWSSYNKTSKVSQHAEKAFDSLKNLRLELDEVVGRDCPDKTDHELNQCYIGEIK